MWAALLLLAVAGPIAAQDAPPDLPPGAGPRGTSGEVRDDSVGFAGMFQAPQVAVLHPRLPQGSFVEVTALDSGRTIAAVVLGPYAGPGVAALSPSAMQALGIGEGGGDGVAVRVRAVTPTVQEQAALRSGQAAGARLDAPPTLLTALRRKLPGRDPAPRRVVTAAPRPAAPLRPTSRLAEPPDLPRAAPAPRGRYGVQVAALSTPDRAAALARQLSGHVVAAGRLYRVQLGPFPDAASAARARDGAVRAGYRDARIFPF